MNYGQVFGRAWEISWNNKWLFILGFLAALGGGVSSGSPQANFQFGAEDLPPRLFENAGELLVAAVPFVLAILCLFALLALFLWLLRLASQAGLIHATAKLDAGEKVSFGTALSAGTSYLLRFVAVNLILYAPVVIGALVIAVGFGAAVVGAFAGGFSENVELAGGSALLGVACSGLILCLLVIYGILVTVIYPFAQRAIVLENAGVVASIRRGWRIVTGNLVDVIVLIIAFLVLGLIVGAILAAVLIPIGFLAFGPTLINLVANQGAGIGVAELILLVGGGIVVWFVAALVNTMLVTYRSVTVTLAFQSFAGISKEAVTVA